MSKKLPDIILLIMVILSVLKISGALTVISWWMITSPVWFPILVSILYVLTLKIFSPDGYAELTKEYSKKR